MKNCFKPAGHSTVSPYLLVAEGSATLGFLRSVFQAIELRRLTAEDGSIKHAEVQIEECVLMIGQRSSAGMPSSVHVYVRDVDHVYAAALEAGATSIAEPRDLPYGDRSAGVRDSQGNLWWLGTHLAAGRASA